MKIKCIIPNASDFDLTYGEVYEVEKELCYDVYMIIDDVGDRTYMQEGQFEVVEEDNSAEWSGEGLPPVGSYVEYSSKEWEVCGINNGEIWLRTLDEFKTNVVFNIGSSVFKPIKSEKQKEIEEMLSNIHQDYSEESLETTHPREYVENAILQLYNLGYRKTK